MKKAIFDKSICIMAFGAFLMFCNKAEAAVLSDSIAQPVDTTIYELEKLDTNPRFKGGDQDLMDYLTQNLKYPKSANSSGRVLVSYVVNADGSISNVKAINKMERALIAEAERVVRNMPKWTPGYLNGKPVRVRYTLPIKFRKNGTDNWNTIANSGTSLKFQMITVAEKFLFSFGVENSLGEKLKVTVRKGLETKSDSLESFMSQLVLGYAGPMKDAVKKYSDGFKTISIESAKTSKCINIDEYFNKNGIVGVEYDKLGQDNPADITEALHVIYDCNNNKVISLSDIIDPSFAELLKQYGIDAGSCTNIVIEGTNIHVPVQSNVITLEGVKIKDNLTELGKMLLAIE